MLVKDIELKSSYTLHEDATFEEAVALMVSKKVNGITVVDTQGKLVGMLSVNELLVAVVPYSLRPEHHLTTFGRDGLFEEYCENARAKKVKEFMVTNCPKLHENEFILTAAAHMTLSNHSRLPVVDRDGVLLGIITRSQIKEQIAKALHIV